MKNVYSETYFPVRNSSVLVRMSCQLFNQISVIIANYLTSHAYTCHASEWQNLTQLDKDEEKYFTLFLVFYVVFLYCTEQNYL